MLRLSAILVGTYVAAFSATSYVNSASSHDGMFAWRTGLDRSQKTDAIAPARAAAQRHEPVSVELIGVDNTIVTIKDRDGRVLFRSDPLSNTTLISRDSNLPTVTVRNDRRPPVQPMPVESQQRPETEPPVKPSTPIAAGCESAVSVLAAGGARRQASLCLAMAGAGPRV